MDRDKDRDRSRLFSISIFFLRQVLNYDLRSRSVNERAEPGALRLLNALKAQAIGKKAASMGLMYVDVAINGKPTRAMVDTGATQHFIADQEARRLGLKLEKDASKMKAVNSAACPIAGLAKGVPIRVGSWTGTTNRMAVPLNDLKVILGMGFLHAASVVPMPFLNSICMLGEESPCMVQAVKRVKDGMELLSALQLKIHILKMKYENKP